MPLEENPDELNGRNFHETDIRTCRRGPCRVRPHDKRRLCPNDRLFAGRLGGRLAPRFSANMQESAKEYGVDLKFANAQGKQEEQLRAVRAFIAQGVDAIIIAPVVVTGWDQVLREAKDAEIPVFLVDRDVDVEDKSLYVTRISADFNLEGKLAGAWLAAEARATARSSNCRARPAPLRRSSARGFRGRHRPVPGHGNRPDASRATSPPRAARR
jgi:cellobiose-specific phosphotransferase system component IIB